MQNSSSRSKAMKKAPKMTVEVVLLWGDTVVSVRPWQPPGELWMGENVPSEPPCDFPLASETLGVERAPLLLSDAAGAAYLVVLPTGTTTVELPGRGRLELEQALEVLEHQPLDEPKGACRMVLPPGAVAHQRFGEVSFRVSVTPAEVRHQRRSLGRAAAITAGCFALSLVAHVGLCVAGSQASPADGDGDGMTDERRYLIQHYLDAAEQWEMKALEEKQLEAVSGENREGGTGTRAQGLEGRREQRLSGWSYSGTGPQSAVSRQQALREAADFGMIGLLSSGAGGDADAPTAPWGRDDALGWDTGRGGAVGGKAAFGRGGGKGVGAGSGQGYGSGHGTASGFGLSSVGAIGHGGGAPPSPATRATSRSGRASPAPQAWGAPEPIPSPVAIDPNGRFSTNYRPGRGTLAAFESAVARGLVPVAARQLVSDVGASYGPTIPLPGGKALAHAVHLERAALAPGGGEVHLRVAFQSTDQSRQGHERLALSLVMDTSGSMSGEAIDRAKQAARRLVAQLGPTDSFSLITFSTGAHLTVPTGAVGPRRAQIERAIKGAEAAGGTNIGAALDLAYVQAQKAARSTGAVPVVLLLSDGQATAGDTDRRRLAGRALRAFQNGVQTSSFGLGRSYDGELMSAVAADGAGGYYYLRDGDQIESAFRAEIQQRLDPAATAVEIRVRLDPDIKLLHVYGSQRLGELEAARERAKEVATDGQAQRRYDIARDRQTDRQGGMRFFIPAFARGDRYSLLLKLAVPAGVSSRQVGTLELRYKDRVFGRNVIEEQAIEIGYAKSDAESAGTIDPSVARTVQGHLAGEDLMAAAQSITRGDRRRAAAVLLERGQLLRRAAAVLEEPGFLIDAGRFAQLLAHASNPDQHRWNDPRALALVLESAARSHLQ